MKKSNSSSSSSSNNPTILEKDKLKILCLHGYRQCGDSFKSKLGSFRKVVNKYAELTFLNAIHDAPPIDENQTDYDSSKSKSWWFNKESNEERSFKGTNKNGPAYGFEESLRLVEKAWSNDHYQGLLGFSQGACFVGLLCSLSERGMTSINPKFAIMSSGFKSGSLAHLNYYEEKIATPSLHIIGETDEVIPSCMSEELAATFVDPIVLHHSGGHYFPSTTQQKQFYINYFQDQLQAYLEAKEIENANSTTIDVICDENGEANSESDSN